MVYVLISGRELFLYGAFFRSFNKIQPPTFLMSNVYSQSIGGSKETLSYFPTTTGETKEGALSSCSLSFVALGGATAALRHPPPASRCRLGALPLSRVGICRTHDVTSNWLETAERLGPGTERLFFWRRTKTGAVFLSLFLPRLRYFGASPTWSSQAEHHHSLSRQQA